MKKIIFLLSFLSLTAFADETYKCYNIQRVNGWQDTTMTISTGFFTDKIKGIELVQEVKSDKFEEIENPFTNKYAEFYKINADDVKNVSKMKFKEIQEGGMVDRAQIAVTESILKFGKTGYARYYSKRCILFNCESSSFFFKCDKI